MLPRSAFIALAASFLMAFPVQAGEGAKAETASSKPAPKSKPTLRAISEHVLKSGLDQSIEAPMSRNLGFNSDTIPAKALRHKSSASPDKRAHGFYVIYSVDKTGIKVPDAIVLSNSLITKKDEVKFVEGFDFRVDLNGKLLGVVSSAGPKGAVMQKTMAADSRAALSAYKDELAIFTERLDYLTLTR